MDHTDEIEMLHRALKGDLSPYSAQGVLMSSGWHGSQEGMGRDETQVLPHDRCTAPSCALAHAAGVRAMTFATQAMLVWIGFCFAAMSAALGVF